MKKLIIILLCPIILMTGCKEEDLCLIGSGNTYTYDLTVAEFNKVSMVGPVNLSITQGDEVAVQVVAEPEMYHELDYTVKDELLEIGFDGNVRCFETEVGVWVHVTAPDIRKIYVNGTSKIINNGDLNLDRLELIMNGGEMWK